MAQFDDDEYIARKRRRQRENLMDQRLRRSRGEEVDENLDSYGYDEDDYEYDYEPVLPPSSRYRRPAPPVAGNGCGQSVLYLSLAFVAVALIVVFFLSRTSADITSLFQGVAPSMQAMLSTPTTTLRTDSAAVIRRVQQLNRLETTSFTIEKVIEAGVEGNPFYNLLYQDKLLLIAHGTVVAGIDLSQLTEKDISISADGKSLTIMLPPAQILSSSLDNAKTRVYQRDRALFAENKDLETQARIAAENQILMAACEDGILQKATNEATTAMTQLLTLADFESVNVVPQSPGQCAAPVNVNPPPASAPAP